MYIKICFSKIQLNIELTFLKILKKKKYQFLLLYFFLRAIKSIYQLRAKRHFYKTSPDDNVMSTIEKWVQNDKQGLGRNHDIK